MNPSALKLKSFDRFLAAESNDGRMKRKYCMESRGLSLFSIITLIKK